MKRKAFKFVKKDEVYFLDFWHITRWIVIERDSIILDDDTEEYTNWYIISMHTDTPPVIFENAFTILEEKKVFGTKNELIKTIDKT